MEWLQAIRKSIVYIEAHLREEIRVQDVAEQVNISPLHFQRGFQIMTGYSISEYIRNRRLYLAALELRSGDRKVIDLAFDYGYETPESFSKAFARFHGTSPLQVKQGGTIRTFLPLQITVTIQGGNKMDCNIVQMSEFCLIGIPKQFSYDTAQAEIPGFWTDVEKIFTEVIAGMAPITAAEKAFRANGIGEYGVCFDDPESARDGKFTYMIAGKYLGGEVPEGMILHRFPAGEWAVFDCVGPVPEALQALSTRIFREWLPGNPDYEISGNANVEWYDAADPRHHSAVWIPVSRKQK